ncbi:MAG: T9SS type A sorting domain-containing protein [Prevotella sp.]|nr:T9SS type A sorting domain-containing protein [Prevotella sp.]
MKRLSIIFLLVVTALAAQGQETQNLVVWQKNGDKVRFDLSEAPVTTFQDGQLVITTSTTTTYYLQENVVRYTYEGPMTPVEAPLVSAGEVIYRQGRDQLSFDGLAGGTRLDVYSADGKRLATVTAREHERAVVSFSGYPTGTYVVRVGQSTYKFLKR